MFVIDLKSGALGEEITEHLFKPHVAHVAAGGDAETDFVVYTPLCHCGAIGVTGNAVRRDAVFLRLNVILSVADSAAFARFGPIAAARV